jgi:REP element-mobilizing transposase RayT
MPWGLRRFQETGQLHFLTFSCYKRRPNFANAPSRITFETSLERVRQRYGLCVYGYVVMPEHIHMLVNEPEQGSLSRVMQSLKQIGRSGVGLTSRRPVLAGSILRFQCMERAQVCGEAPLYSPESGNARVSCASRRLGLEQPPSLCKW